MTHDNWTTIIAAFIAAVPITLSQIYLILQLRSQASSPQKQQDAASVAVETADSSRTVSSVYRNALKWHALPLAVNICGIAFILVTSASKPPTVWTVLSLTLCVGSLLFTIDRMLDILSSQQIVAFVSERTRLLLDFINSTSDRHLSLIESIQEGNLTLHQKNIDLHERDLRLHELGNSAHRQIVVAISDPQQNGRPKHLPK